MLGRPTTSHDPCQTKINQQHYQRNKEERSKQIRERQKQLKQTVADIKLSLGCSRCHYSKCARALEFHHTNDDKEHNIARMVTQGRSLKAITTEIAKCICVCANCHAELHDEH